MTSSLPRIGLYTTQALKDRGFTSFGEHPIREALQMAKKLNKGMLAIKVTNDKERDYDLKCPENYTMASNGFCKSNVKFGDKYCNKPIRFSNETEKRKYEDKCGVKFPLALVGDIYLGNKVPSREDGGNGDFVLVAVPSNIDECNVDLHKCLKKSESNYLAKELKEKRAKLEELRNSIVKLEIEAEALDKNLTYETAENVYRRRQILAEHQRKITELSKSKEQLGKMYKTLQDTQDAKKQTLVLQKQMQEENNKEIDSNYNNLNKYEKHNITFRNLTKDINNKFELKEKVKTGLYASLILLIVLACVVLIYISATNSRGYINMAFNKFNNLGFGF